MLIDEPFLPKQNYIPGHSPEDVIASLGPQSSPRVIHTLFDIELLDNGGVVLDGYLIPHIKASKKPESNTSEEDANVKYWVSLDNRFGYPFSTEADFSQAIYLVANAMAVACGYSSFGKHCHPTGKFNQYVGILGNVKHCGAIPTLKEG